MTKHPHYSPAFPPVGEDAKCHGTPEILCRDCARYAPGHTTMAHILGVPEVTRGKCRLFLVKS
jgi:hypothetical protein